MQATVVLWTHCGVSQTHSGVSLRHSGVTKWHSQVFPRHAKDCLWHYRVSPRHSKERLRHSQLCGRHSGDCFWHSIMAARHNGVRIWHQTGIFTFVKVPKLWESLQIKEFYYVTKKQNTPQPAPKKPLPASVPQGTKSRSGKPPLQGASPFFTLQ